MGKRILVTGAAGFIGAHLAHFLKQRGDFVIGIDNFNTYYDPRLKWERKKQFGLDIEALDICNQKAVKALMLRTGITHVVHLAAQAGVRHSILCPDDYVASNLQGFVSILEACRSSGNPPLIYASSSSVYGLNEKVPFHLDNPTERPANLYGATKKANELMAHAYHNLYGLHVTALRYFTVYGPWGRPDMAYYHFAKKISLGEPIQVFNHGRMRRDFTYIDDIIQGTVAALDLSLPCATFNLGNNRSIELSFFIQLLEAALKKRAILELLPMQMGEVIETYADIQKSCEILGYQPRVPIEEGIKRFIEWFQAYEMPLAKTQLSR